MYTHIHTVTFTKTWITIHTWLIIARNYYNTILHTFLPAQHLQRYGSHHRTRMCNPGWCEMHQCHTQTHRHTYTHRRELTWVMTTFPPCTAPGSDDQPLRVDGNNKKNYFQMYVQKLSLLPWGRSSSVWMNIMKHRSRALHHPTWLTAVTRCGDDQHDGGSGNVCSKEMMKLWWEEWVMTIRGW